MESDQTVRNEEEGQAVGQAEQDRAERERLTAEPTADLPPAAERLREFEDEHFGEDAVRIGGAVEKGHGSKHRAMTDDEKAYCSALEQAVEAEKNLADARAKLSVAEAEMAAAEARVTGAHEAHEKAKAEREKKAQAKLDKEREKAPALAE
jgi:hypothetical protein